MKAHRTERGGHCEARERRPAEGSPERELHLDDYSPALSSLPQLCNYPRSRVLSVSEVPSHRSAWSGFAFERRLRAAPGATTHRDPVVSAKRPRGAPAGAVG